MRQNQMNVNDTNMTRTDNGAIPIAHHDVVSIFKTVGARAIADALLAFLELF